MTHNPPKTVHIGQYVQASGTLVDMVLENPDTASALKGNLAILGGKGMKPNCRYYGSARGCRSGKI